MMGYKSKLGVVEALQEGDNLKVEIEWESDFSSEYYYFTRLMSPLFVRS